MARGLDVLRLTPSEQLTQNEIDAASLVRLDTFNAQNQPKVTWPSSHVVAKAYLDQLARSNGLAADRLTAIRTAFDKADRSRLDTLAADVEKDAATARGGTATRLKALAAIMKDRGARAR